MKLYTRLIVLFGGAFGCVAINFWLITTRRYRWPLVVFVAYLVGMSVIIREIASRYQRPRGSRLGSR
jgi:hypothetical protein